MKEIKEAVETTLVVVGGWFAFSVVLTMFTAAVAWPWYLLAWWVFG